MHVFPRGVAKEVAMIRHMNSGKESAHAERSPIAQCIRHIVTFKLFKYASCTVSAAFELTFGLKHKTLFVDFSLILMALFGMNSHYSRMRKAGFEISGE
jgi:hydrogenase-4 membrane subunit HyfE